MFDLNSFIVTNLVKGVKNGTFTKEYANITAVNYLAKGMLTEDDVISVNAQVEEWEAEKNAVVDSADPSEEIMVEDLIEELGTETETTEGTDSDDLPEEETEVAEDVTEEPENVEETTEETI